MGGAAIIIWILVFFGIFYFLAIRPQRRQRQAHADMVRMLKKGDEIVTIGGMFGTVKRIGDDWVELEIAKRTRVRYLKRAISQITASEEEDEDEYIEVEEEDYEQDQLTEGDDEFVADEDEQADDESAPEPPEAPLPPKA